MDLFESARIPQNVSLEDMIKTLVKLKKEGHFQHIGLGCPMLRLVYQEGPHRLPDYYRRD